MMACLPAVGKEAGAPQIVGRSGGMGGGLRMQIKEQELSD
jgi:hypothetical protein